MSTLWCGCREDFCCVQCLKCGRHCQCPEVDDQLVHVNGRRFAERQYALNKAAYQKGGPPASSDAVRSRELELKEQQ